MMLTLFLLGSAALELILRWSRSTLLNATAEQAAVSNYRRFVDRILRANTVAFARDAAPIHLDRFAAIAQLRDHHAGQNHALLIDLPFTLLFAGMIAMIGGWLVMVPIAGLTAVLVFSLLMKRAQWALFDQRKTLDNRRYAFLSEVLSSSQTVKANRMERQLTRRFELLEDQTVDISQRLIRFSGLAQSFGAIFGQLSVAAMGLLGAYLVIQQQIGIAEMAACMLLNGRIVQPLTKLMTLWVQSENLALSWSKLREVDALPVNSEAEEERSSFEGELTLEGVRLVNEGCEGEQVIVPDLCVQAGQTVLIEGSAAWQSQALFEVIAGQRPPAVGQVLIDGQPATSRVSERGEGALVILEPDPAILSGTLLENISAFGDEARVSRAKDFAAQLGLEKRVHRLPMGYNTKLGTGSGFENDPVNRQLIALVRVLALRPRLLIMSEPTAVLDTAERDALSACLAGLVEKPTLLIESPDPRMKRLAEVTCKLSALDGDDVADWEADARLDRDAAENLRRDVA